MTGDRALSVDPRAVRVSVVGRDDADLRPIVVEPSALPVGPRPATGSLAHGDGHTPGGTLEHVGEGADPIILVDGEPTLVRLERAGGDRVVLVESGDRERRSDVLILGPDAAPAMSGTVRREVLIDGWSILVDLESERRASLRERASRGAGPEAGGGPLEIRAVIPGRLVSVGVVEGDAVVAGRQLLVLEAMKMQNEVRAPRDGIVTRVAVGPGQTIELGDLLVVLG
jgi:acetyl/propionyl-CoA carboxylase alpha subunit